MAGAAAAADAAWRPAHRGVQGHHVNNDSVGMGRISSGSGNRNTSRRGRSRKSSAVAAEQRNTTCSCNRNIWGETIGCVNITTSLPDFPAKYFAMATPKNVLQSLSFKLLLPNCYIQITSCPKLLPNRCFHFSRSEFSVHNCVGARQDCCVQIRTITWMLLCQEGRHRSAFGCCVVLMLVTGCSADAAMDHCRVLRRGNKTHQLFRHRQAT